MYFFDKNIEFSGNIACLDDEGKAFTYEQIWDMGDRMTENILAGSLVLLLCSNNVESYCIYMALLRKRCPVILLGNSVDKQLINEMRDTYRPEFVIGGGYSPERVNEHEPINEELGLLLSTSGSTGARKLVRLSYRNIQANCDSIVEYLSIDKNERAITTLPMEYTYGLSVIHSHAAVGASVVLTDLTFFSERFWEAVNDLHVTSMAGVPYSYEILFRRLEMDKMSLPYLKTMTQAGGHLKPDLQERVGTWARQTGRRFFVMYGQTEATARMSYIPPEKCLEKIGSIGIPIPGGKIEIIDDELIYYGDNVSMGYATSREDLTAGDDNRGRLETGDMAYADSDGYFFITGRKKRFIKLQGKRIGLDGLQEFLQEEMETDNIVCTGTDDTGVHIWIAEEAVMEQTDLIRKIFAEKFGIRGKFVTFNRIDEIPRNESGKILYNRLK